jgi:hypothetical protein
MARAKGEPMAATPDNHTLGSQVHASKPLTQPTEPPSSTEYPRALYHKDSTADHLIVKTVANAEEAKALGKEWGSLADLKLETAPARKDA